MQPVRIADRCAQLPPAARAHLASECDRLSFFTDEQSHGGGVDPGPISAANPEGLRIGRRGVAEKFFGVAWRRGAGGAILVGAREHAQGLTIGVLLGDELLEDGGRPFESPAACEGKPLELTQPDILRKLLQPLPNDIVCEERPSLRQQLFPQQTVRLHRPARRGRVPCSPESEQRPGVEPGDLQLGHRVVRG